MERPPRTAGRPRIDNTLTLSHSVAVTGLVASTTYNYRVRSKDAATNERLGINNTFRTLSGPDTTPPTAPGNVSAVATSPVAVSVSWNASSDNVGVTGYSVLRDGAEVGTPSAPSYEDNAVARGTTYTYSIVARDAAGNTSAPSPLVSVSTPAMMFRRRRGGLDCRHDRHHQLDDRYSGDDRD
jgi:chitodextrinase